MSAAPMTSISHIDAPQWWEGYPLAESIHVVVASIESGSWVDQQIGSLAASLDLLAVAMDPVAMLGAWAVDWVIEHTPVLRQKLSELSGDPARITTQAQAWRQVAQHCHEQASLAPEHANDLAKWTGEAAAEYRSHANAMPDIFAATAQAALGIAAATELAGRLVATVRVLVRELISQLVARLAIWAAAEGVSLGLLTPLVTGQAIPFIASLTSRALTLTEAMARSIANLRVLTTKLGRFLDELEHTSVGHTGPLSQGAKAGEQAVAATLSDAEKAMTLDMNRANPYLSNRSVTKNNCANSAVAYSLRRKGIDVEARPLPKQYPNGRPLEEIEDLWNRQFTWGGKEDIEKVFTEAGPGAQGFVSLRWKKVGTSHVFNVENVDGHVRFVDTTTGSTDVSEYFTRGQRVRYLRTDDITPVKPLGSFVRYRTPAS